MKRENNNAIHSHKFTEVKNNIYYRTVYVMVDLTIALLPILILNIRVWELNECWYFVGAVLCGFSCIHPFLCLNFLSHKMSKTRTNLY